MNTQKVLAIVWVLFWTAFSALSVGTTFPASQYTWELPILILILTGTSVVLGYCAGTPELSQRDHEFPQRKERP